MDYMHETTSKNYPKAPPQIRLLKQTDVIHVQCSHDTTVLLAFNVKILSLETEMYVKWYDSSHIRTFRIARILENTDTQFSFECGDGKENQIYRLSPLTLKIYNDKVKESLLIPQDFATEEELLAALRSAHVRTL